jgi:hypothetical protein
MTTIDTTLQGIIDNISQEQVRSCVDESEADVKFQDEAAIARAVQAATYCYLNGPVGLGDNKVETQEHKAMKGRSFKWGTDEVKMQEGIRKFVAGVKMHPSGRAMTNSFWKNFCATVAIALQTKFPGLQSPYGRKCGNAASGWPLITLVSGEAVTPTPFAMSVV